MLLNTVDHHNTIKNNTMENTGKSMQLNRQWKQWIVKNVKDYHFNRHLYQFILFVNYNIFHNLTI